MKYEKTIIIMAVIFLFTPLLSVSAMETGVRNPAAAYCVDLGYEYDIKKSPAGEYGVCVFPDGSEANEWKFFAGQEKREYNFCTRSGYGTKTVSDERCISTNKCALCILEDGTEEEVAGLMGLKAVVIDQGKDNRKETEEKELGNTDYFKDSSVYLIGAILIGLIAVVFFVFRKFRTSSF